MPAELRWLRSCRSTIIFGSDRDGRRPKGMSGRGGDYGAPPSTLKRAASHTGTPSFISGQMAMTPSGDSDDSGYLSLPRLTLVSFGRLTVAVKVEPAGLDGCSCLARQHGETGLRRSIRLQPNAHRSLSEEFRVTTCPTRRKSNFAERSGRRAPLLQFQFEISFR